MTQDLVTGWAMAGKGRALWLVGDRKYKVQSVQHPLEKDLTYTNDAAAGRPQSGAPSGQSASAGPAAQDSAA